MGMMERNENQDWVIYSYTAEQAVADGVLVEVEQELREQMGFVWPVRLSQNVNVMVNPSEEEQKFGQSREGRLWDVLYVAHNAIRDAEPGESLVGFEITFGQRTSRLWACLDTTSGPAIHLITPEEY